MNEKSVSVDHIERSIVLIRGHKVILDKDLAEIYGVSVKRLNEQVKRNLLRFPEDFAFQLSNADWESLRSQYATLQRRSANLIHPRVAPAAKYPR